MGTLSVQPVKYEFISVHHIVGFSTLPNNGDLPIVTGQDDVVASLVADPNPTLAPLDRDTALRGLMLGQIFGQGVEEDLLRTADERAAVSAIERTKRFRIPGVFLVIRAVGGTETQACNAALLERAVIGFDAVDKATLKQRYQPVVAALLTATVLVIDTNSADLDTVAEEISLTLQDGRALYSMTLQGGTARATTARAVKESDAVSIGTETRRLLVHPELSHPSRLLVDAMRRHQDRLESFLLAWASLEMLINTHTWVRVWQLD